MQQYLYDVKTIVALGSESITTPTIDFVYLEPAGQVIRKVLVTVLQTPLGLSYESHTRLGVNIFPMLMEKYLRRILIKNSEIYFYWDSKLVNFLREIISVWIKETLFDPSITKKQFEKLLYETALDVVDGDYSNLPRFPMSPDFYSMEMILYELEDTGESVKEVWNISNFFPKTNTNEVENGLCYFPFVGNVIKSNVFLSVAQSLFNQRKEGNRALKEIAVCKSNLTTKDK